MSLRRFEHMHIHRVLGGIMQDKTDEIEGGDQRESLGEVTKQCRQFTMGRDRFRDVQQRAILHGLGFEGVRSWCVVHIDKMMPFKTFQKQRGYSTLRRETGRQV